MKYNVGMCFKMRSSSALISKLGAFNGKMLRSSGALVIL